MSDEERAEILDAYLRMKAEVLLTETLDAVEGGNEPPSLDAELALYLYDQLMRKGPAHCRRN